MSMMPLLRARRELSILRTRGSSENSVNAKFAEFLFHALR
jgi:hypothetical protein